MTPHTLRLDLGSAADLDWAQETVAERHYLRQRVDPRARPMAYVIRHDDYRMGLVMLGIPHATKCGGWWAYVNEPVAGENIWLFRGHRNYLGKLNMEGREWWACVWRRRNVAERE